MNEEIIIKANADIEVIKHRIYEVRGQRVMLDRDLAELYGVETRVLNQAVKRNIERFPADFMFQLTAEERDSMSSQFVMTSGQKGDMSSQFVMTYPNKRPKVALPYAFTEHGALMLASVLKSPSAIQMSVMVTRAFIAMREALSGMLSVNYKVEQLSHKVDNLNARVDEILHEQNDNNMEIAVQIEAINDALDQLRENPSAPRKQIGYKTNKQND
ncbi:MAG: ORF6N domain-containing protein [Bacteroidales bacterium]|nr:ORF6N domain-containing protein [Bacteroidales bacterium]